MKIATSILNATNYKKSIEKLNNTTTDYIHIDVMDNKFVPNYKLPVDEVNYLGTYAKKPFDIHLMIDDPENFINNLNVKNTKSITIHIEIDKDISHIIKLIKNQGFEAGLAIKPNTDLSELVKYLNDIDKVIIMSVEPGYGGQKFIENSVNKINNLRKLKKDILIEVDGGINIDTIDKVKKIVDIVVVGSYITNKTNYQEAINNLKN